MDIGFITMGVREEKDSCTVPSVERDANEIGHRDDTLDGSLSMKAMTSESPPTINLPSTASDDPIVLSVSTVSNTLPSPTLSKEDLELLARLELQNRLLEADAKSLNSLTSGHSRKSSSTSLVSVTSGASQQSTNADEDGEDVWQVWGSVVSEWDTYFKKKNAFVKDLVRRGIPLHFRSIVWQLLCNAQSCPARELYTDYLKSTSPCEKVILRDIARTYPEHEFFREKDGPGQESLFNVMKAYSLHDREVGYCQGSAFIVGLLLLQMPEEDAFSVMVRLMEDYRLREMYKPSMAELGLCMYQLECVVQEQISELHMHFQTQSFHTSMYASSWFLTLFTSSLPFHLACRVMDLFLSEGMEIIFKIGIAILQYCKEDLLQHDMEGMLRYFQKEMPAKCEADPDYLISLAMQVKYSSKKMKKLEKDYMSYKAREQEEMVELRRLRTENKLLRQRIEHLEQESASLADRLVQGQVTRAQEAEDNYAVKRELASLKQQELLTQQELERAYQRIKELHEANSQHTSLDTQTEDLIRSMQQELIAVKLREAENQDTMQDLIQRIHDLEAVNKCLKEALPESTIIHIQEEMISVKLREAESQLYIKELLQKICDLQAEIDKMQMNMKTSESKNSTGSPVKEAPDGASMFLIKNLQQKTMDLEAKVKENEIKRISIEVEHGRVVAELKKKIEYLENQNKEFAKTNHIKTEMENEEVRILRKRVTELQLKLIEQRDLNRRLSTALENVDGDANHNTEGDFRHISSFLEKLRQSRGDNLPDEGNFEQVYKLRLASNLEMLKNKVNT